ncbi:MAG TPA: histidine phosphatase family protein [Bryobacteraceae bacterium]|nr:histidine phosphatase family protein [Bryobacteraceae bacterium]
MASSLWLLRHGETAWSISGQHTSTTDLALTAEGERTAAEVGKRLAGRKFSAVYSSPMARALETCRLSGYAEGAIVTADLCEWNYGKYEGLTTPEIQKTAPGWTVWTAAPPGGETIDQVAERARAVIHAAIDAAPDGDVAIFGHGHMLRVLAACWLQVDPRMGRCFALSTGSISVLGYERDTRVLRSWNQTA